MAYKSKKEYKKDKKKWKNSRMRARSPRGYDEFKMKEAAYKQFKISKKDDKKPKKKSKKKSKDKDTSSSVESDYMSQQSDIADMMKEFQIQQQQQMQQYEKMLAQQAAQAKKEQEKQLKMLQIQQQNTAAAAQTPNFQLQGAGLTPKLSAAQQFRKRLGSQFGTASPYTGLAQIQSGMVNV